jgi:hypothetical protein
MGGSSDSKSLSNGLVGYWKMDEGVGTTTADYSGNNNTGTFAVGDSSPGWSGGKYGIGTSFWRAGGISTGISTPFADFTISVWFKDDGNIRSYERLVDKSHGTGFWIGRNANMANSWGGGIIETVDPWGVYGTFPDTQWNHLIMLRRGTTQELYANGFMVASKTVSANALNTNLIRIGDWYSAGQNNQWYNVSLTKSRIYNRALSPAEVMALYEYAPGPIGYWNFDENIGTTAYDRSGNNNHGTLGTNGSMPTWTTGKYGSALKYDGIDDYTLIPDSPLWDNFTTNDFTFSLWAKIIANDTNGAFLLSQKNGASTGGFEWWFNTGNTLYLNKNTSTNIINKSYNRTYNKWTYYTVTKNNNTYTLYADGVSLGSTILQIQYQT